MTFRRRTDANHAAIRTALRRLGWYVLDTSRVGHGFPDLVVARAGIIRLIEVKDGSKSPSRQALTDDELHVLDELEASGIFVQVVRSIADAEALR